MSHENNDHTYDREAIAAIITPPGEGGIGAIRIAGYGSHEVLGKVFRPAHSPTAKLEKFKLYYGYIVDKKGDVLDEVTAVTMPEGESYTGQEQAEIFCHGGTVVLRTILAEISRHSVRPAEPGEFTRRAFLNGRIDLARAEAVAELIGSKTEYSYTAARKNLLGELSGYIDDLREKAILLLAEIEAGVDYPEEYLETADGERLVSSCAGIIAGIDSLVKTYRGGKIIREGFKVAIAGRPNAGKSSLFNLLLNQTRAIVAPVPGTTRDYLTEWIDLEGAAVSLTDTAGLRRKSGQIEKAGQAAALEIMDHTDLIIWIADISRGRWVAEVEKDMEKLPYRDKLLIVLNKADLVEDCEKERKKLGKSVYEGHCLSCKTKKGLEKLRKSLNEKIHSEMPDLTDSLVVTSERHKQKLDSAREAFERAEGLLKGNETPELVAFEIRQGIAAIDEITGRIYNEEILDRIFASFCIGK